MISAYRRCLVPLFCQLFVGVLMSCLRYLCLLAYSGVQHILCCAFVLFFFVLSFLLDCPFVIAPSVFSKVYSHKALFIFTTFNFLILYLYFEYVKRNHRPMQHRNNDIRQYIKHCFRDI